MENILMGAPDFANLHDLSKLGLFQNIEQVLIPFKREVALESAYEVTRNLQAC